jgi:adenylate cyclase
MRCLHCELDNREGRKFCARCGGALGWTCSACGFGNAPGDAFCGGCGRQAEPPAGGASPPPARTAEESGERRQVTILFADLCGFTALSAQLDAEDLRRLVDAF